MCLINTSKSSFLFLPFGFGTTKVFCKFNFLGLVEFLCRTTICMLIFCRLTFHIVIKELFKFNVTKEAILQALYYIRFFFNCQISSEDTFIGHDDFL